jgi:hypothetical protein
MSRSAGPGRARRSSSARSSAPGCAFDIRDPFQPRQVAAFEPAGPVQINDVYVTADGIVYAVDRDGGGLYILEYSGPG